MFTLERDMLDKKLKASVFSHFCCC